MNRQKPREKENEESTRQFMGISEKLRKMKSAKENP